MIQLQTTRLIIRNPLNADLEDWHSLISNPKTMFYLQDIMTHSKDESLRNLEVAISEAQNPSRAKYFFVIEHGKTGAFIGNIGYTILQRIPLGNIVEMGYFLLPEYQGQGYATEALNEVVRFAFEEGNVFRIATGCLKDNVGSEKVMIKCGFIKEADFKSYTWHDGEMKDRVLYRLLKSEWENEKSLKTLQTTGDVLFKR